MITRFFVSLFPKPLKRCVASSIRVPVSLKKLNVVFLCMLLNFPSQIWTGILNRFVRPFIVMESHYMADSQNDMLVWLVSEAKGVEGSVDGLTRRLHSVNFAGIHMTALVW